VIKIRTIGSKGYREVAAEGIETLVMSERKQRTKWLFVSFKRFDEAATEAAGMKNEISKNDVCWV
jgi:hypothetical protein